MVDYVTRFQSIRVNLVSSRRFLFANYVIIYGAFFSVSRDVVLTFCGTSSIFIYKVARFFTIQSSSSGRESSCERKQRKKKEVY